MSNPGIYATRFDSNSKALQEFEKSLSYLRDNTNIRSSAEANEIIEPLVKIMQSLTEDLSEKLTLFDKIIEKDILGILRNWHREDWMQYKNNIQALSNKLAQNEFQVTHSDFEILNDVSDALDAECQSLFQRMRGRK